MFRRLKNQLLLAFLTISILSLVQALVYIQLSQRKEQVERISHQVHLLEINVLEQAKSINDFFTYETCKEEFYTTSNSDYLKKRNAYQRGYYELTEELNENESFHIIDKANRIEVLSKLSDSLNIYIDSITQLIHQRGFKDYGIEGEMRLYAHQLEKYNCIHISDILMLRRHEKDYIIRNDQKYVDKFNDLTNKLNENPISTDCREKLLKYKLLFNDLVVIDRKIGVKDNSALRLKLDQVISAMMSETFLINQQCSEYREFIYKKIKTVSISIFAVIMATGFLTSIILSKLITRRITLLTRNISEFVKSGFTKRNKLKVNINTDEIGVLISNFEIMRDEICNQINYLEKTVAERTEEIIVQKEHILKQNKKMKDSIRYAQNIQNAILPSYNYIEETLPNHFIFFQPKDIVSGDFYWYKHIKNDEFNVTIVAVADCTGHGVPGGLMSMLGISALSEIIHKKDVHTATDVLNQLREKITETLSTKINGQQIKDGMDIALTVIDHKNNKIQFAGAHRPLYLIRKGELIKIKGDSMPIGRYLNNDPFTLHEIDLHKNDQFYLCTDGFVDQHNKLQNKKYLEKNFKELLLRISTENLSVQKSILERELNNWKSDAEQTDDILVLGFRI